MAIVRLPYERTRSTVFDETIDSWAVQYWTSNGSCTDPSYTYPSSNQSASFSTYKHEGTMTDVVTPNFRKFSGEGRIINSPLTKVVKQTYASKGSRSYDSRYTITSCTPSKQLWRGGQHSGTMSGKIQTDYAPGQGWADTPTINVQNLIDIAVTQMWANADHSKAAALASLGEAKETINSMISIIGRLIKIIIAIKKLDFKYLYSQVKPKELEKRYMELRYAIRPLFYDCKQVIDAAQHRALDYDRYTFRGKASDSATNTKSTSYTDSFVPLSYRVNCFGQTSREVVVRSGLLCHVSEPSQIQIWGLDNIAETAWELLPFSFIIDWFFNVGQTIASWTPEVGLQPLTSWSVVKDTVVREVSVTGVDLLNLSSYNFISPRIDISNMTKREITVTTTRSPDTSRRVLPTFNLNLDALKLVDLLIIGKNLLR